MKTVLMSKSKDSAINLAMEESLLSSVGSGEKVLFLYENNPAVIIGRFQNPWKECRTGLIKRNGVVLRRRISGGGTVVHGPGNLNISFISGTRIPEKEKNLNLVVHALSRIGVKIEMNSRYDLVVKKPEERDSVVFKVSGSAFRQTSSRSIHHATLLVNADLAELGLFLHGPTRNIETRSVPSNPSPVANLSDISPGLTVSDVVDVLVREWDSPGRLSHLDSADFEHNPVFHESLKRLLSNEWTWGKTPGFKETILVSAGGDELLFEIDVFEGRMTDIKCTAKNESNTREDTLPDPSVLLGCFYQGPEILAAFPGVSPDWVNILAASVDGDERLPGG